MTFQSAPFPLAARAQTAIAYADEVIVFRRTLLHAGSPNSSRWYRTPFSAPSGSRALVYLQRGQGTGPVEFPRLAKQRLVPALRAATALTALRTQVLLPWSRALRDTPNVAHDNPDEDRLHA